MDKEQWERFWGIVSEIEMDITRFLDQQLKTKVRSALPLTMVAGGLQEVLRKPLITYDTIDWKRITEIMNPPGRTSACSAKYSDDDIKKIVKILLLSNGYGFIVFLSNYKCHKFTMIALEKYYNERAVDSKSLPSQIDYIRKISAKTSCQQIKSIYDVAINQLNQLYEDYVVVRDGIEELKARFAENLRADWSKKDIEKHYAWNIVIAELYGLMEKKDDCNVDRGSAKYKQIAQLLQEVFRPYGLWQGDIGAIGTRIGKRHYKNTST